MDTPCDDGDRAFFAAATRVTIWNGEKASFWCSNWLSRMAFRFLTPKLYKYYKAKSRTVARALRNNTWIQDINHSHPVPLLQDYVAIWQLIDETDI
ncbi:hypothetical protein E2562_023887 [Oryza meyeriana var. granulata]|uniref:Reverse transcriptase zinc-binding domain-containing protein n=1 Tax=Oryza meyeriana var. granulata TaxID=110450 RepID=A0A6G1D7A9_9ORYZ|nr:hypothetical protein E2562_023887 [Oryza meyeriana var. granulata]